MSEASIILYGKRYTTTNICTEADEFIRLEAAQKGFALNQLINDHSPMVRASIARLQYGHEQLIKDPHWTVRATVAKHCKPLLLELLMNDDNHFVRYIIAKRGFYLEHFSHDPDEEIAALANYQLKHKP